MAVTIDNTLSLSKTNAGASTAYVFPFTCSGTGRVLLVWIFNNDVTSAPTSVTYNGIALTKIEGPITASGFGHNMTLYALKNPSTGNNDIRITTNTNWNGSNFYGNAVSVNNSSGYGDTSTGATSGVTSDSIIVTSTTTDDLVIDSCKGNAGNFVIDPALSMTSLFDNADVDRFTTATKAGASGNVTVGFVSNASSLFLQIGVNLIFFNAFVGPFPTHIN